MKRRIIPVLLAFTLLAAACDGHENSLFNQEWSVLDVDYVTNHGQLPGTADTKIAFFTVDVNDPGPMVVGHRVCLMAVSTYNSSDDVAWSDEKCSDWGIGSGTGDIRIDPPNIQGTTAEAFESRVEMVFYVPNTPAYVSYTCEYHDANASNPTFCPGHEADGDPTG